MASKNINFNIDRTRVKSKENVLLNWDCVSPESVVLVVEENGVKNRIDLPDSGSRSLVITQPKGKVVYTLKAVFNGKVQEKSITVDVKAVKEPKAPRAPRARRAKASRGPSEPRNTRGTSKLKTWFGDFKWKAGQWWSYLSERKKLAYIALSILAAGSLLSLINPQLASVGYLGLVFYLFWVILKR